MKIATAQLGRCLMMGFLICLTPQVFALDLQDLGEELEQAAEKLDETRKQIDMARGKLPEEDEIED